MLLIFCSLASYVSGTLIIVLLSSFGVPPYICYLIGGLLVTYQVTYIIIIIHTINGFYKEATPYLDGGSSYHENASFSSFR
jgi:hypothetical protein